MTKPEFTADPDWLVYHPAPSVPQFTVPPGAVDAHCHVFGPARQFPFAPARKYTPCDAPWEALRALRDHLGFARNVIVQASCHGNDNRALCDALERSEGMARGVASVAPEVSDDELAFLHQTGVRGVRFNFVRRLADWQEPETLAPVIAKIASLGWHVVVYFEAADLPALYEFLASVPVVVVVDHMGRPDVSKPVDGEAFGLFLRLMRENSHVWTKLSCPERLSLSGPTDYNDVLPFARTLIEAFPDRVLWGTDWPHPNLKSHMPDDGNLVDLIPRFATTGNLQEKLLVDNPMRLYWAQ